MQDRFLPARKFGGKRFVVSHLSQNDGDDICLPTDLHRATALQAFAAGKHVFCEKPIALSTEDAMVMTEAALLADRQLMVGHCIRFWPEYVELKRMVDSGKQGRLLSCVLAEIESARSGEY